MTEQVTIPRWAEHITVSRQGNSLLVRGVRRRPDQVVLTSDHAAQPDPLAPLFLEFTDEKPAKRESVKLHILFSLAVNRDSMISFVRTFGPIWGRVEKLRHRADGTDDVTVRQSLRTLKQLQRQVMNATDMVAKLKNLDRLTGEDWDDLVKEALSLEGANGATLYDRAGKFEYRLSKTGPLLASPLGQEGRSTEARNMARLLANWEVCRVLNKYSPVVSFFDRFHVRELPDNKPQGILPTLYFLLRQDYLAEGRTIANCANCNRLFTVTRKDQILKRAVFANRHALTIPPAHILTMLSMTPKKAITATSILPNMAVRF